MSGVVVELVSASACDVPSYRLRMGAHLEEIPLSMLEVRIDFYARMAALPGEAKRYGPALAALRGLKARLEAGDG